MRRIVSNFLSARRGNARSREAAGGRRRWLLEDDLERMRHAGAVDEPPSRVRPAMDFRRSRNLAISSGLSSSVGCHQPRILSYSPGVSRDGQVWTSSSSVAARHSVQICSSLASGWCSAIFCSPGYLNFACVSPVAEILSPTRSLDCWNPRRALRSQRHPDLGRTNWPSASSFM